MKTESPTTFAAIRFTGDALEPQRITEIVHTAPTTAYRSGQVYKRSRGREVRAPEHEPVVSSGGASERHRRVGRLRARRGAATVCRTP